MAFSNEAFLSAFLQFVNEIASDRHYRLNKEVHTELPFRIEEMFRPYLEECIRYKYPKEIVSTWSNFLKLNPTSPLLPLDSGFKTKDRYLYKVMLK